MEDTSTDTQIDPNSNSNSNSFKSHFSELHSQSLKIKITQKPNPSSSFRLGNINYTISCLNSQINHVDKEIQITEFLDNYFDILAKPFEYCPHILNHCLKTRNQVIKNNEKKLDIRDQGFARPKVLIILPSRQDAFNVISTIIRLSKLEADKVRFEKEFQGSDDCFTIGLKLSRKVMKLYSSFYSSDLIVASPLGLSMMIGQPGDKKQDFDFLSSIEIVVIDRAEVILMQNWEHARHIFAHLNLIPRESHGCDFSRVKNFVLDGESKFVRQSIICSDFNTPEISSLFNSFKNVAGKIMISEVEVGIIRDIVSKAPQSTIINSIDTRFQFFVERILPTLRNPAEQPSSLIIIPSYFDYVRVRAYLNEHNYSAGFISEYTSQSSRDRTRTNFNSGETKFLCISERFLYYKNVKIQARHIVFYSVPIWAKFYTHFTNQAEDVSICFSEYEFFNLERIVGTYRSDKMIKGFKEAYMFSS